MARLTGALFSLAASGTIADTLTFAKWKGIQYVRTRVIPANPKSVAQQEVRGIFSTLNAMYKRMPTEAREPWDYAVRGLPLTARNRFIQANVAALIDDGTLIDLVLSVASGQAIPMEDMVCNDGADGTAIIAATAPTAPVGYTLTHMLGLAVLDGDPGDAIARTVYFKEKPELPYSVGVDVPINGLYRCRAIAIWTRTSDSKVFASTQLVSQTNVTGN